ncbi:MAG: L-arabinose isomerase [Dermatophilaceae bacterium]
MTSAPSEQPVRRALWFLTGSQDLYGPDVLAQVEQQSRAVADELDAALARLDPDGPRVVWQPVLTTAESIRRACRAATDDGDVVGVVVWMHTFSPAKMWIAGLAALGVPLLHLHTQANRSLPWSDLDMDFMNLNQAAHGDREAGHVLGRTATPRATVAGHVADPDVHRRVRSWSRAALGLDALRSTRVVRFGDNMRGVAVTEGDKVGAQIRLGLSVDSHPVGDLAAEVDAVTEDAVAALVAECLDAYQADDDLLPGGSRHSSLWEALRIEAGLRTVLEREDATAFTTNFEDLGGLRQLPGLAVQRLMAQGYGFGGEGDWKTAGLLRTVKAMAGPTGGASFMEDYTYHWGPGTPKVLGAHMLEVCPSITDEVPRVEVHPLAIGGREDPARLVFTATPSEAVVAGLSDVGGRLRLTVAEVDVVEPDAPLPRLPVARAVWVPRPDLATSAEAWLTAGAPHHTVLSTAVSADALACLADLAGVECVRIDATTDVAELARTLRWDDLWWRLSPAGAAPR